MNIHVISKMSGSAAHLFGRIFLETAEYGYLQVTHSYSRISKECIETILRSIGEAVQDLADFSFIFLQICIANILGTK